MSTPTVVVRWARRGVLAALAGVILASCAAVTHPLVVVGHPALSINVALSDAGCTTSNQCAVVGANDVGAIAEYRGVNGAWHSLPTPEVTGARLSVSACTATTCLFGGSAAATDVVWRYDAVSQSLSALTPPPGADAVVALSCADSSCAMVDQTAQGENRLSVSRTEGSTWASTTVVPFATTVTALSCSTPTDCVLAGESDASTATLWSTSDAGATWRALATSTSWNAVRELTCASRGCVAWVQVGDRSVLAHEVRGRWHSTAIPFDVEGAACSSITSCLVVGEHDSQLPALATWHLATGLTLATLRYVPTALVSAACGRSTCVSVAVTTVAQVPLRS